MRLIELHHLLDGFANRDLGLPLVRHDHVAPLRVVLEQSAVGCFRDFGRIAAGRPTAPVLEITITELVAAYWKFATGYYVKNGKPTGELSNLKDSLSPVVRLYGTTLVGEFGPLRLRMVREAMAAANRLFSSTTENGSTNEVAPRDETSSTSP